MKSLLALLALGACVLSVSSAKLPKSEEPIESSVARGGWGSASEFFSGPPAIFFAPVIAVGLIFVLWIAAYNTLRSPPPKIGFGGGAQGGGWGGWGAANAGWGVSPSSGWAAPAPSGGWAAASEQHETAATAPQAAAVANAVEQTVQATGQRSLDDLTHRVLSSIERGEQAQY